MASAWSQLDQLLTCAICLDRYRNPKLLPCQHTFCMEPCLDGLIDYARRQIKCPECRAEHRIPYKGIQEYPTNVTLMRFLELHRDITGEEPEPPPSMMERCGVCSEKANLEKCAHCDKKICPDCKEAHIDILRREINRINNQVRRGLHRLADALSQTKKNAEKLQQNCTQVKDEIEDIVRRYAKDLKHTEEKLKVDLQMYTETELKAISKLKEDLEAEVSNMSSNCDLVDKHIKDDEEWSDAELLEYKDIFIKMLDFLRSFDADTTDYSRKIKFQPRADPDVLHRNIADFGELKINAPPSSSISQQSLAPPSSNALMRSQSDHRLAAQFARRTEGRSFADRYGGSDSERDPGRPTSPLYGRGRRETDSSSGYRRYTRDYDSDRSNRYTREENVSSSILSSRWRDSDEYGHRSSRYPRDYEDYDSEPQQQHSRSVRFADDPQPRERIFDVDEATKGPLSGVIRLMDSPKLMERLHQNEVRQKQQQTEKEKIQSQVETPPIVETRAPVAPQAPPRKTPVRQASEDDIDRQKKANQANSSTSSNTQSVPSTQDALSRSTSHKPSTETTKTQTQVPVRAQRKELVENSAPTTAEISNSIERQETRVRKQPSIAETVEEPEITTPSITRRSKPALGKTVISDGRGSTTTQQQPELTAANTSDTKPTSIATSHPSLLALRSKRHENEENNRKEEVPIPAQSSFFSRQRRLPDPEPRLLENQTSEEDDDEEDDDVDEDDDDDEEEDETEDEDDVKLPSADLKLQQSANKSSTEETVEESESEESSTESSTTESESEDSDAVEDDNRGNGVQGSSHDADNKTTTTTYRSPSPKYESPLDDDEDDDDDCEVEDAIDYCSQNQTLSNDKKLPSASIDTNASRTRFRRRSDDLDTADSSSGSSSSTNYKSFSNTPTILSNGNVENNSVDSENNSSNSSHRREPRFANVRKRPTLARSKSSHELGLGYEDKEEVDDDDEVLEDSNVTPKYRSRSDRSSEDNIIHQRPCRKYGSLSSDNHSSMESTTGLSPTSSSWATYLKNKYSGNGTGRVVPRSRSSHSLYQKTDSESSDDEPSSSVLGGSMSFPNARSTYMQKRRMLFKIGSRGTEPGNFTWPRGIAVGPEDSIVVADSSNHRVQVFDVEGHFSFEFGSYGSSEGQFDCLSGVSVNRIGQFIVSDRYNHRVQLFDPSGRFLRAFGSEGHTDGRFNYPWGITTDSLGFIYVCDKDNHRVQVFQSDGTFVGKFGCLGSRPGQLEHPHYIAVSNTNRVVVSDSNNHRVQIYDVNGRTLSTFGSEGSGEGQFKFPRGVAVDDQGFIIVGDSGNNRIQIFHPDGTFLRGFGTWGSGEGEFKGLEGIAVASSGNILVCDRENHRIQVF